jgi:hypothetical protein
VTVITLLCDQCHDCTTSVPKRNSLALQQRIKRKLRAIHDGMKMEMHRRPQRFNPIFTAVLPLAAALDADAASSAALVIVVSLNRTMVRRAEASRLCNIPHS